MGKRMMSTVLSLAAVIMTLFPAAAFAQSRATAIGFRGTYWDMANQPGGISVRQNGGVTNINVGSGGGWLYFYSRVSDGWLFEFSLGVAGKAKTEDQDFWGENVEVNAVTPVLLGFRHNLLPYNTQSDLQPYLSFGAGPYWINDIKVRDRYYGDDEEVYVKSKVKPGGYAGGGLNFMLGNWVGLNFDIKYHFVDFRKAHPNSGYEYGLGFFFTWGHYHSPSEKDKVKITIE
jgi:outer membrane protein W